MKKSLVAEPVAVLCALFAATVFFGLGSTSAQDTNIVLNLNNPGIQLMSYASETGIYQHVYMTGLGYHVAWQSGPLPGALNQAAIVRIGDIDNDGEKEVVACSSWVTRTVNSKGIRTEYHDFQILVYKNGCSYAGSPDFQSGVLGEKPRMTINDCFIADVDNLGGPGNPHNELVLIRSGEVDVWRLDDPLTLENIGTVSQYNFSVDVGDADNMGDNEIVVSSMDGPYPVIFKRMGLGWEKITPEAYGAPSMQVRAAKIRDVDNLLLSDGKRDNEIIARGGGGLLVWKFEGGAYKVKFVGGDVGGGNGVDAWDSDLDGNNEVLITGLMTERKRTVNKLFNYSYSGGTYVPIGTYASPIAANNNDFVKGNLDGEGVAEVAVIAGPNGPSAPLKVLHFSGVDFLTVYSPTTIFFNKLEIR